MALILIVLVNYLDATTVIIMVNRLETTSISNGSREVLVLYAQIAIETSQ